MDASPSETPSINDIIALLLLHIRDVIQDLEYMHGELTSGTIPLFPESDISFRKDDSEEFDEFD